MNPTTKPLKQYAFYKGYENLIKDNSDDMIMITGIESEGDTLEELYDNCTVGLVDWNGNDKGFVHLDDLSNDQRTELSLDVRNIFLRQQAQDSKKGKKSW